MHRFSLVAALLIASAPAPAVAQEAAPDVAPVASVVDLLTAAKQSLAAADFVAAAEGFRRVLRVDPNHRTARSYLAECHLAVGQRDAAEAVATGGDPDGLIFGPAVVVPAVEHTAEAEEAVAVAPPEVAPPEVAPPPAAPPEVAPPPVAPPPDPEPKKDQNPRAASHGAAGLAVFAPVAGAGIWVEARPHWVIGILGSVGGAAWERNGGPSGVVAVAAEVAVTPVPFVVTPEVGVGFAALLGDGAWQLVDGRIQVPLVRDDVRATPYARLALRADLGPRFSMSLGVVLLAGVGRAPVPLPSVRLGGRFP